MNAQKAVQVLDDDEPQAPPPREAPGEDEPIILNFGPAPDTREAPALIAAGKHRGSIVSILYGISKSSGGPMFTVVARLEDPPWTGRRLTTYLPLAERAIWKLRAFLLSMGHPHYTAETLAGEIALTSPWQLHEDFEGADVEVEVVHETYRPDDGSKPQLQAKIKVLKGYAHRAAPAPRASAAVADDDEIPF